MEDEQQQIIDNSDLRKYRIELPNMADDDLDVYQFRLYAHYKRVGNCFEGVRTTAEKTKMSVGQVVATRDWLAENKWIAVKKQGPGKPFIVTVRDRWLENFKRYSKASKSVHPMNTSVSPHEQGVSPGERKKEPTKKEPKKKTTPQPPVEEILHPYVIAGKRHLDTELTTSMLDWLFRQEAERDEAFILEAFQESDGKPYAYLKRVIEKAMAENRRPGERKGQPAKTAVKDERPPEERYAATLAEMDDIPVVIRSRTHRTGEPSRTPNTIWETAYGELAMQMPRETFDTWLRSARLIAHEDDTYTLGVANQYAKEWLEARLDKVITRTLGQVAGRAVTVKYVLWDGHATEEDEPDHFGDISKQLKTKDKDDEGFGDGARLLDPSFIPDVEKQAS